MGAGASVDEGVAVDGELAKVLSASDGDLAAAADKLNRDIKRMVPKTASGRLDAASIKEDERESVLEVLGRARRLAEHGYAVSWGYYCQNCRQDGPHHRARPPPAGLHRG